MKTYLDRKIVKSGTESFVKQKDLFDLEKFIIQVSSVPPVSSSGDNFANADLTLTGNRLHEGVGQNIDFSNYGTWDVLTEGNYTVENSNSGIQILNGVDTLSADPVAAFRVGASLNDFAMNYLIDAGVGDYLSGLLRVKDGGLGTEKSDIVAIQANGIELTHFVATTLNDNLSTTAVLSGDNIELRQATTAVGVGTSAIFRLENTLYHFKNTTDNGFKFPVTTPSAEYEALVDDGTVTGTMEFRPTVPNFVQNSAVKLPGKYNGRDHYRITKIDTWDNGDTIATLPATAVPYNVYGVELSDYWMIPYNDGTTYLQTKYSFVGKELIMQNNTGTVDCEITIHYYVV